jgi:FAD:protein FMN transferase
MKSALSEVRRARPLLGTFVEIAAWGTKETKLNDAIDHAFAAVAKVHRLMSFHDSQSDVSRINRDACRRRVTVDPWTWRVLEFAQKLARESDGVFDISVARMLAKWNYLPQLQEKVSAGDWRDIILEKRSAVRLRTSVIVDLGGIAKGFAVDRAVAALKLRGVTAGIVNAGGDVRVFGSPVQLVHLRNPSKPAQAAGVISLRDRALATSGIYFTRRDYRGEKVSPLVNGRTGKSSSKVMSVSVAAATCVTADALTKVVFALRDKAAPLLKFYRADALMLERDGSPCWMFSRPCVTRDQTRFD